MRPYLWELRPYFRQVAGQLVLGSLCGIIMNTAVVLPAILLGRAIDTVLAVERGEADVAAGGWAALALLGGTLLTEGPRVLKRWWLMTANARIRANLRADALRGVLAWPMARLQRTPIGDLMSRIIGDVEVLGVGVREFTIEIWDTVLFSISFVVAMLLLDARLAALTLLPVPVALALGWATGRWVGARTKAAREANAGLTTLLQEQLAGLRVLRLFGRTEAAVEQVAARSHRFAAANLATVRLRAGLQPVYTIIIVAGGVSLIWQGGEQVIAGAMTVGAFVTFLELYRRFVERGHRIPQLVNSIQGGGAAYTRVQPLLAPPRSVRGERRFASFFPGYVAGITLPATVPATPAAGAAAVRLEGATFTYPGNERPSLIDVSLDIPAGALVAVTGPVGAGKSALARALLGLYPLTTGRVLLDGQPLEAISAAERAVRIGYLPQEPHLFSGSVAENIRLAPADATGRPAGDDELLNQVVALTALGADVQGLPAGLATDIGEQGIRISGGQRQRIGLARALAAAGRTPGLLVLDDPFSAVDVDTETRIVAALREAFGPTAPPERRATILLCSHRLLAFPQADLVVVLEGGRVVEQGTHVALLAAGRLYARIYQAQRRVEAGALVEAAS